MVSKKSATGESVTKPPHLPVWTVLASGSVGAVVVALLCTRWGIGTTPDSALYIGAASRLARGEGLTYLDDACRLAPLTHFPPLYSWLLSLAARGGTDLQKVARVFQAACFSANVWLIGWESSRPTGGVRRAAFGCFLALTSIDLIRAHGMAWSEPLFIICVLLGMIAIADYLGTSRRHSLVLGAVALSLALLTRYAAAGILIGTAVAIYLRRRDRAAVRCLADTAIFLALASAPSAFWLLHNIRTAGNATNRKAGLHLPSLDWILEGVRTASTWAWPGFEAHRFADKRLVLSIVLGTIVAIFATRTSWSPDRLTNQEVERDWKTLLIACIISYLVFILFSASFFDSGIPFDGRILSPVFVLLILVIARQSAVMCSRVSRSAIAFVLVGYAVFGAGEVLQLWRHGQGYRSGPWRASATVQRVRTWPPEAAIYSNGNDVVFLVTEREACPLPLPGAPETDLASLRARLAAGGAVVLFDRIHRDYRMSENELRLRLDPLSKDQLEDGAILTSP